MLKYQVWSLGACTSEKVFEQEKNLIVEADTEFCLKG